MITPLRAFENKVGVEFNPARLSTVFAEDLNQINDNLEDLQEQIEDIPAGPEGPEGPTGPAGPAGNTVLYGTAVPTGGVGNNGDFYIRTTTNFIYGPKASGIWPSGVSLVGPQGATGAAGTPGSRVYTVAESDIPLPSGFGVVGDYAITEDIGRLYRKTGVSTWSYMFPIRSNAFNEIGMTMVGYNTLAAPADNSLYYFGSQGFTASSNRIYYEMPYGGVRAGLIKKIYLKTKVTGTLGSAESTAVIRLYVNGSLVASLTGQQLFNTADGMIEWDNIDWDVAPGDMIAIGVVTPTWATNPTTTYVWSTISILPMLF